MASLIVLGSGPAGLMAAHELARAGHDCLVLEASTAVGGMAGSFEVAGQRVDHGSHRLHPAAPAPILRLIGQLLGSDLQRRPRNGRLRLADRWVGFPLRTAGLLRTLPPGLTARLTVDSMAGVARSLRSGPAPETFDEAIEATLGPTVGRLFYGPYADKLYGTPARELDADLARRRVSAASPLDIARRLARARRPAGREFLYPRRGSGQIVERLAEAATDAGAEIRLGQPVTAVEVGADGVSVGTPNGHHRATTALSTLPGRRLADLLDPDPPAEVTAALARQRTRAMLLVYLVVERARYSPFDAHYVPGPETPISRLSEPKNYRDGDDPPDRTVLCAEIPCWPDDDIVGWTADDLAALVGDGLHRLGLPPARPVAVEVRHLPSVYPVFDRAGREDRAVVGRWQAGTGPVVSLGRQGLGVIDNLHHVLEMGAEAAAAIDADGTLAAERWAGALARFATNTVED